MTRRIGCLISALVTFALLSGAAAFGQQTDAQSAASQHGADAVSSASQAPQEAPSGAAPGIGIDVAALVRTDLYRLAEGPLLIAACLFFVAGFFWKILRFRGMTRAVGTLWLPSRARRVDPGPSGADLVPMTQPPSGLAAARYRARRWLARTVFGAAPVMGVLSLLFHIALFLVPLLLPAHNELFRRKYHWGLPTLPTMVMDRLTFGLLAIGAFFLLRRILYPRVRALSTVRDYLIVLLVAAPFVTGVIAVHGWMDFRTIMAFHMTSADLLIGLIPFTKLGHMPFLIYSRFFVSAERAWRPAHRRW